MSTTLTVLEGVHTDEVWNISWSHDGSRLASASKDKTTYKEPQDVGYTPQFILGDHPFAVNCLAWSPDDSALVTSSNTYIKLWDSQTGLCTQTTEEHTETITSLAWLVDGTGFFSGALDRKIILWDSAANKLFEVEGTGDIRILDLAIIPDSNQLIIAGMEQKHERSSHQTSYVLRTFNMKTQKVESSTVVDHEICTVAISRDSQFALYNQNASIQLYDLQTHRVVGEYTGHLRTRHVIHSRFGGIADEFIISGSEDGNVYIWHRNSGRPLEVLYGHGEGGVNCVSWNPQRPEKFASCSDDHTIRIWETSRRGLACDTGMG
ncbi:WD40-repeat-containing domain protein [Collybia nuda]|uniref:WD40-repeat-containing domain protein n=1 Tax=Collybia nuda TaxID=64659 RepID=A0A9P5YI01_9AGAR|nr:WD40-repeat-containing domain protein [Collybia nuda]